MKSFLEGFQNSKQPFFSLTPGVMSTYERVVLNRVPISRKLPVVRRLDGHVSPLRYPKDEFSQESFTFVNDGLIPCHCWNPNSEVNGKFV